jgi:hypothetical protein
MKVIKQARHFLLALSGVTHLFLFFCFEMPVARARATHWQEPKKRRRRDGKTIKDHKW